MALIKSIDELKKYINIDVNTKFSKMEPHINEAEALFIEPLLGREFYREVLEAYDQLPTDPLSAELAVLLPYIQKCLACYAGYLAVDELGVSIGDLGIQQQYNQNSQPAPMSKVANLKIKYLTSGDKASDLLLEFLELAAIVPAEGDETDRLYKTWYDSEANTSISGTIVYKASIAKKHIDIGDSRRLFLRLKKRIKDIESFYVKRLICKNQYEEIVSQLRSGTLTPENRELTDRLEPVIAKRALHGALAGLPVIITADGLFLQSSNDSVIQKLQAGTSEKDRLAADLKSGDFGYESDEQKFIAYLKENINDYPLVRNSPCWTEPVVTSDEKWKIDNHPCNKSFST